MVFAYSTLRLIFCIYSNSATLVSEEFFKVWASCCSNHCLAAPDLGADVEQPFNCLKSSRTVRPCSPWGGRWIGHWRTTWSTICSSAPHSQGAEEDIPHLYKQGWKRAGCSMMKGGGIRSQSALHRMGLNQWRRCAHCDTKRANVALHCVAVPSSSSRWPQECSASLFFCESDSRCRRYVSVQHKSTPWCLGLEQNGRSSPSRCISSSRLASLQWRLKTSTLLWLCWFKLPCLDVPLYLNRHPSSFPPQAKFCSETVFDGRKSVFKNYVFDHMLWIVSILINMNCRWDNWTN